MAGAIERRLAKLETAHGRDAGAGGQYRDLPLDQPARIQNICGILGGAFTESAAEPPAPLTAAEDRRARQIIACLEVDV